MTGHSPFAGVQRRTFLGAVATSSAALSARVDAADPIPTIKLGDYQVTRLIAGYNPIGGYSHSVPKLSAIMRNWFTEERTTEFLLNCEKAGINTWQASYDPKAFAALRKAREKGSKLQWICLIPDVTPEQWKEIVALKPIAVVHHGEATDRLWKSGYQDAKKIGAFVQKVKDFGLLAGVSSHNPEIILRAEEEPWKHDFYMNCFYNIRRDQASLNEQLTDLPIDELYLKNDPHRMTKAMRTVTRPCLGFKILAAGRKAKNADEVKAAFEYAFSRIKTEDAVIVGMFPILTDEVAENASIVRGLLSNA
ncbi:MAG: hypothetical protein SGI92_21180 [Bryobacteraceae bacterium]|nr:hypothetical protein [Bryobacteraceae bacterium]